MEHKRLFVPIISVLMALIVPLVIYLYNFNSVAFDENFYKKEFLKYDVYENLGNYDIENINNDVLDYLAHGKNGELIENDFFNEREKKHLLDVKSLIEKILAAYYFSLSLFLLMFIFLMDFNIKKTVKRFLVILSLGSFLTLLDAVLLFILSNFNFYFVFDMFHKTFFSSGSYIFDPAFENIVVLYPQNLFFDALISIIFGAIITSLTILFFCAMFFIFSKRKFLKKNSENIDVKDRK